MGHTQAGVVAQLLGRADRLDATYAVAGWLLGRGLRAASAYALIYTGPLLVCVGMGTLYDSYLLLRLAPRGATRLRQALGLALLGRRSRRQLHSTAPPLRCSGGRTQS